MKKLLLIFFLCCAAVSSSAAEREFRLYGRVKESAFKTDLTSASVIIYGADGLPVDTIRANKGLTWRAGAVDTTSIFSFVVPRVDSTYVFDVVSPGYKPQTVTFRLENIGKRELYRNMPAVFLERAPRQLKELTVTSTKIKFYNKGDTLVYNADAFQLAEGSMLDALIAQLPGVELSSDGQIKVNGEFVESLLLNGKEFMDGNSNLMLENIAAYTVKDVQVYQGQSRQSKVLGDFAAPKRLTMDVKLKKEYNMGIILNAQGGYGTNDRYLGRLFAQWFTPTTRLTLIGNVNNLNDNRQPGKNDNWTPESMPTGTKEYRMGGFDYDYENTDETRGASGRLLFAQTVAKTRSSVARTNFLSGGDTYDNSFTDARDDELRLSTSHSFNASDERKAAYVSVQGSYERVKNSSSALSATFGDEQPDMTRQILEAIYSDGTPQQLDAIINRVKTRSDGRSTRLSGAAMSNFSLKFPKTQEGIGLGLNASYDSDKEHLWRDYIVNYGANATPAVTRRQYIDNTPNHNLRLSANASYRAGFNNAFLSLRYRFEFADRVKDSYTYSLERLADMGIYGIVPSNYLEALDPANSYASRTLTATHTLEPYLMWNLNIGGKSWLSASASPKISVVHRHFDYWRNDRSYRLSKTNFLVRVASIWDAMIEYRFNGTSQGQRTNWRNSIRYSYRIDQTLPEMADMVDVVDDSDPLNIYYGNPALKVATHHRHLFRWCYSPASHALQNILYFSFSHTDNELTRGYTYDTTTGIRHNRMYNVGGNCAIAATNELSWQFGTKKQFSLSSETDFSSARTADMIGVDKQMPEHTSVDNRTIGEKLKLGWQFARQSLQLRADYLHRHTSSTQSGFADIDAWHLNWGLSGTFSLPAGFGITTDFICYTRRGYGSRLLDTTDPVWNARLSYCPPRASRWVFCLDGFDILHRLSNVKYAVTAAGRTVSCTNTIPRYVILSIQYRLNIQPKRK